MSEEQQRPESYWELFDLVVLLSKILDRSTSEKCTCDRCDGLYPADILSLDTKTFMCLSCFLSKQEFDAENCVSLIPSLFGKYSVRYANDAQDISLNKKKLPNYLPYHTRMQSVFNKFAKK